MSKKEKATREYLETLSKDQVIDLCLQFMFDAEIAEQQLDQANERLGKFEDILEKYGVESLDTLEHIIKKGQVIASTIEGFAKEAYNEIQTDRDTWQKACKLACKWFKQTGFIGDQTEVDYYYQQAKKEGE